MPKSKRQAEEGSVASDFSYTEDLERGDDFNDEEIKDIREIPDKIVPYLVRRAFHIPGNSYFQDWYQYCIANNHPFFGLFCHYKFHPVTQLERVIVFLASICASLVVSNTFLLYFLWKDGLNANEIFITQGDDIIPAISYESYELASLTLGAILVTIFDLTIWYIAACGCVEAGGKLEHLNTITFLGSVVLLVVLMGVATLATLLALLASSYRNDPSLNTTDIFTDGFDAINTTAAFSMFGTKAATNTGLTFVYQLLLSLFAYDIIFATTIFSGVLGGLPFVGKFLGGRPAEIKQVKRKKRKAERKKKRKLKRKKQKKSRRRSEESSTISLESDQV